MTQDDLFSQNATMRKVAHLTAIDAESPEGQEISELMQGMAEQTKQLGHKIDMWWCVCLAYALGMERGKEIAHN